MTKRFWLIVILLVSLLFATAVTGCGETPEDPPPPPPAETTLYGAMASNAECSSSGLECGCHLTISFDGKDLTSGSYPVTRVILRVNGNRIVNNTCSIIEPP